MGVIYIGRQNKRMRHIVWVSSTLEDKTKERDGSNESCLCCKTKHKDATDHIGVIYAKTKQET